MKRRVFISDTWDSGNYLTRFVEVWEDCPDCGGEGVVEVENEEGEVVEVECETCLGTGEVMSRQPR